MVLLMCVVAGFRVRAYRALVMSALMGFITTLVWVLVVVVPAVVGFALSMAAAVAWCIWLERHPHVHDHDDPPIIRVVSIESVRLLDTH